MFRALPEPPQVMYGTREHLEGYLPSLAHTPPRMLILFQLDYLAFWCRHFCPVVVLPMHDQSRLSPDSALGSLREVGWISFSKSLHQRLGGLGLDSRYFQYAPDPDQYRPVRWGRTPRGYFWERMPRDLDRTAVRAMARALGNLPVEVRSLPDVSLVQGSGEKIWKNRQDYLKELQKFHVYFAPRKYEGIGMTFLEAMAMGMCVVAENAPTANEYILSGRNGILYGSQGGKLFLPVHRSPEELCRLGMEARKTVRQVHDSWIRDRGQIAQVLHLTSKRFCRNRGDPNPALFHASLEFGNEPGRFWAMVSGRGGQIWRSRDQEKRQARAKGWRGFLRQSWRHPRKTVLAGLQRLASADRGGSD
ncbi:glycosyltransferase [bacterium]|nr:glycosyltransferase [bacterium]